MRLLLGCGLLLSPPAPSAGRCDIVARMAAPPGSYSAASISPAKSRPMNRSSAVTSLWPVHADWWRRYATRSPKGVILAPRISPPSGAAC